MRQAFLLPLSFELSLVNKTELTYKIKEEAIRLGFNDCGIAQARFLKEEQAHLQAWLDAEYNADMEYMKRNFDKRLDPRLLVDNAKSVIVVALNYYPEKLQEKQLPQIAKYAYGKDYHKVIKNKLFLLLDFVKNISDEKPINARCFTDSAPVLERKWAKEAGLGRIGKNTTLVHPKYGSFILIGEIILDLELEYDNPVEYDCGTCTRCIQACPTGALSEPKKIDARKCISYHTIENQGKIPEDVAYNISNCLFGCDICINVCPGNIMLEPTKEAEFTPIEGLLDMTKEDWESLTEEEFNSRFKDSPIARAGYQKIMETLKLMK